MKAARLAWADKKNIPEVREAERVCIWAAEKRNASPQGESVLLELQNPQYLLGVSLLKCLIQCLYSRNCTFL